MSDEPSGWHLSANGLEAVKEVGRWVMAAIAVALLWVQQHNQHTERVAITAAAREENTAQLKAVEASVKELKRPLVFGDGK